MTSLTHRPVILLLSRYHPRNVRTAVTGVFQRLRILMEAAWQTGAELHVAFYLPDDPVPAVQSASEMSRAFQEHWSIACEVHSLPGRDPGDRGLLRERALPLLRLSSHRRYRRYLSPASLDGLADVIRSVDPDLVVTHRLEALVALRRVAKPSQRALLDLDDVEHIAEFRRLRQGRFYKETLFEFANLAPLMLGTARLSRWAANTLVCSSLDKARLDRSGIFGRISVVPNSIQIPAEVAPLPTSRRMLFVGGMGYGANVQAIRQFVSRILPVIRARMPEAVLEIVGKDIDRVDDLRGTQGVMLTGFVEDLARPYAEAAVVVSPITAGSGTRVKICEAAAYGRPVVSTPLGAEGLEFEDGRDILIRGRDTDFAAACCELMSDHGKAQAIAAAARELAVTRYDRKAVVGQVCGLMAALLPRRVSAQLPAGQL